MLDTVFMQILDMTKTASIVILFVILTRLILKKAPKVFSYLLWAVVLFRLLCPVSIELPVSAVPEFTPVAYSYTLEDEPVSFFGASEAAYQAVGDVLNGGIDIQHIRTTERDEAGNVRYASAWWWEVLILFGQYVWLFGIAVMVVYSMVLYYKLRQKLVGAIFLRDNIFLSDYITSPFVMGMFRPKIYLPSTLTENEQEYIILHEQHHIRRFDHITKALAFLALCIHWFNPLVWFSFVLSGKDMEMSCDEAVIKKMGAEIRADYSSSLLSLATGRRIIAGTPLAFGEGDTKGRIKNLANYKKPAFWIILIAVVASVVLAVCFMTDPKGVNGGTVTFEGVDEISELSFDMDKVFSDADSYTVYEGTDKTNNYFEAKRDYFFLFSGVYSFLYDLSLSTIVDGTVNHKHEPLISGVIEVNSDKHSAVSIIFHDDFSKMYMIRHSSVYSVRSKDYAVTNPSEAKKFFNEKPFADDFRIWKFNPASSAWGNAQINVYIDSRYRINGEIKGAGTISRITNKEKGCDGISWSPEIIENPGDYKIEIPVIRDGEERVFSFSMTMVGKSGITGYYKIGSDVMKITDYSDGYIFELSPLYAQDAVVWYYSPTWPEDVTFCLPVGYELISAEASSGKTELFPQPDFLFNLIIEDRIVHWFPDENFAEDTALVITAEKDGKEIKFEFYIKLENPNGMGRRKYIISPVNCWMHQEVPESPIFELLEK